MHPLPSLSAVSNPLTILDHSRSGSGRAMVYAVRSRRSRGLSIGVNLFPHKKVCDLDCIYCEVDNPGTSGVQPTVELLRRELTEQLDDVAAGRAFPGEAVHDVAFSGDGEPTISPIFGEAVDVAIEARRRFGRPELKLVLITDALTLHRPATRAAVDRLMANGGEIWAKLDAGTQAYFELVGRGHVPIERPIENIRALAQVHPVVIQSLFLRVHGSPPPDSEIDAYAARLRDLAASGAKLQRIDVYTVARPTTEPYATALSDAEVDAIAAETRAAVPGVPVEAYYSTR